MTNKETINRFTESIENFRAKIKNEDFGENLNTAFEGFLYECDHIAEISGEMADKIEATQDGTDLEDVD